MRLRDLDPDKGYTPQSIVFNTKDRSLGKITWTDGNMYGIPPVHDADYVVFVDYADIADCQVRSLVLPKLKGKHNKADIIVEREKNMQYFGACLGEDEILCYTDYDGHWYPFDKAFDSTYDLFNRLSVVQRKNIETLFIISRRQLTNKLLASAKWNDSRDSLIALIRHTTFGHMTEDGAMHLAIRLLDNGYIKKEDILKSVADILREEFLIGYSEKDNNIYQFTGNQLTRLFKSLFNIEV